MALFCCGIFLHSIVWAAPLFWLVLLLGLLLAAHLYSANTSASTALVAGAIVCAGIGIAQFSAFQFRTNHIGLFAGDDPRLTSLEIEFSQAPRLIEDTSPRHLSGRQVGPASVVAIKTTSGWQRATGDILFTVAQAEPRILAGQRLRVVGMLQRPSPSMNPGQFDWERYYRRQGVLASIRVNHACDVQLTSSGVAPTLAEARTSVREWLALGFSPTQQIDRSLLQALMLGDRGPEMRAVERDFQKTGTSHLLASSGVRMAILAAIVYLLCRLVRARPRVSTFIITLSIVGWGCVTMPSPQAIRPVVVAVALGVSVFARRNTDSIQILAYSALLILLVHPLDLYNAGFQFSFGIVLGMLLLIRPCMQFVLGFRDPDQVMLDRHRHFTRWQRLRRWMNYYVIGTVVSTVVAWIVSLPLVAYHFEQFTPWAVPISIALSPVVFVAIGAGFLKLIATMLVPSGAALWATMASWPVALLRWSMIHMGNLPGADIPIAPPPVWGMVLFYLILLLPLFPVTRGAVRVVARSAAVGACAMLLFMPWVLGFAKPSPSGGTVRVTLLSVGAGQCAVVELPHRVIMVDDGSSTVQDPLHLCVAPFIHHEGADSIQSIYLSHGDYDHISATAGTFTEYGVQQVVTTPFFRKHADESVPCRRLLQMLDRTGHPPSEVVAGHTFDWGDGVHCEVLWPPKSCKMDSNNAGMVLRLTYGGRSILFPADIQDPAMRELLRDPAKLKSDVLVAPHHGSSEPLTAEFVRAVNPRVIVSSNAARLTKKQRDFEQIIEHRPLYRTSQVGAIEIDFSREGKVSVTPFVDRKRHGLVIERDGRVHGDR